MPHELFLTTIQKTKIRNASAKNMSMDMKLNKAVISKIVQTGGFLCDVLGSLSNIGKGVSKKPITILAARLDKNTFPGLVSNLASNGTSNAIDKFRKKIDERGALVLMMKVMGKEVIDEVFSLTLSCNQYRNY